MDAGPITQAMSEHDWAIIARRLHTSPQEVRIMRAIIVNELKTDAIGHRLGIKRRSVDTQLKRLYDKLGVHSHVGLAVRVFTELLRLREDERNDK